MKGTSKKDLILAIFLLLAVAVFAGYRLVYMPKMAEMASLQAQIEATSLERTEVEQKMLEIPEIENKIAEQVEIASKGSPLFFNNIPQENLIVYLSETESDTKFNVTSYGFSPLSVGSIPEISDGAKELAIALKDIIESYRQQTEPETEEATPTDTSAEAAGEAPSTDVITTNVNISFSEVTYSDLHAYLKSLESFSKEILVSSLSLSASPIREDKKLPDSTDDIVISGSMVLDFYILPKLFSHESDLKFLDWDLDSPKGKTSPFMPPPKHETTEATAAGKTATLASGTDFGEPDFFVIARAASTGLPTMTIGYAPDETAETYVRSYAEGESDVTIELTESGGEYFYRYTTADGAYPPKGTQKFTPLGDELRFIVYSNIRVNENDINKINITVQNDTSLDFNWLVTGDDKTRPRIDVDVR